MAWEWKPFQGFFSHPGFLHEFVIRNLHPVEINAWAVFLYFQVPNGGDLHQLIFPRGSIWLRSPWQNLSRPPGDIFQQAIGFRGILLRVRQKCLGKTFSSWASIAVFICFLLWNINMYVQQDLGLAIHSSVLQKTSFFQDLDRTCIRLR